MSHMITGAALAAHQASAIVLNPRARGLFPHGVRAEAPAPDAMAIFGELKTTVEAFIQERDKEVADIKKGLADVVQSEKVDKINDEITALQKALDGVNASLAALKVGGGGGGQLDDPTVTAHAAAFGQYFRRGVDADLADLQVKAKLSTDSDPDGGYVVPEMVETMIDRVLTTVSTVRSMARVMSISTDQYKKLVNMGGATSGWVGEHEARPETSTPTLREIILNVFEMYAQPAATQRSLDDARINIADWLADEVQIEFAEQEGAAFVAGDGIKKPRGFLDYDKVANASYAWGKTGFVVSGGASGFAATDPADALIDLFYALRQGYRMGAEWIMSDATMGTVRKFKDGDGTYLWQAPTAAAELPTILGKPVRTDDNMPAVGSNTFPIAFANWPRAYMILDRQGIRVLRDPYTAKPNVMFYTTKRVGGGLINFEAIKLLKIST